MKVCNVSRQAFYKVLAVVFEKIGIAPKIAEVGVLRGNNARVMYDALKPNYMWLVDPWKSYERFHYPFSERPFYIAPESNHDTYFGGSIHEQATFDKIFATCQKEFSGVDNVSILRADSIAGIDHVKNDLQKNGKKEQLDLVYIDGDHEYEFVLRDLMYWEKLLGREGVMMLNDCCFSPAGAAQNLGVLEAVTGFVKRTDFIPVLLTNTDFTDVVLVRKGSTILDLIDKLVVNSNIPFVEVPYQMLPAMRVVYGKQRVNVSFC